MKIIPCILLLGVTLAGSSAEAVTPQAYTVTNLLDLSSDIDFTSIDATGINASGKVTANFDYYDACDTVRLGE